MPICTITTSLPKEKIAEDFLTSMSALVAKIFDKPEQRVIVIIHTDKSICCGGSLDPAMVVHFSCIDRFGHGADQNKKYSAEIFKFVAEKTGLPFSRIKVHFHDLQACMAGVPPSQ